MWFMWLRFEEGTNNNRCQFSALNTLGWVLDMTFDLRATAVSSLVISFVFFYPCTGDSDVCHS